MFFALRTPKTKVFTMFFASGSKNHGIYSVFVPAPSKNTGIYAVFSMLQDVVLYAKRTTPLYFTMFLLPERSKTSSRNGSKTVPNRLPKASYNFSPGPPKTTRFGGCGWCLSFGGLALLPTRACSFFPLGGCVLVFVFWRFGASARFGVFLFPLVVVVGVVFWRAGASACFALFLFPFACCDWHFLWCSLLVSFD